MKYRIKFESDKKIKLPVQYNKIVQASLLNWIGNDEVATKLHDEGYCNNKRTYKLYTFSNLIGKCEYLQDERKLVFDKEISIVLSFYDDSMDTYIKNNVSEGKALVLGNNILNIKSVEYIIEKTKECIIETVSPITMHSTFVNSEGRKKTYYYEPHEKDFSELIKQNLIRKYIAYYNREPDDTSFEIKPLENYNYKCAVIKYKDFGIKGWRGKFRIIGSDELIKMALLSGVGARNSIGLGCVVSCGI